ncbi:MAG TPA: BTAD domain-containing putative transcriptional regulator, partial [Blastocatellia bacterium]|nr:BTAD domain-containing putative transcriptional regulator [Blastocatellia bacterium]
MNLRVMGAQWTLELFGWLRAEQGGRAITRFRTQKTGALLAYLAYYRHRAHPREELIELLWPNCEIDAGRHSLSVALSSLRHQMEPPGVPAGAVIVADRASVQLNPAAVTTDVAEFEAAIQSAARAGSAAGQAQFLTTAVELYRGELLPGYYEDWVLAERERLADEFFQAVGRLVAHLEQAGELSRALSFAHRAIQIDPLREPSHRDLMRLSAALGQPAAALRQYRELERILGEELGVTPDAATQDLARRIAAQPCRGDAQAAAAPARHPAAEPMLPALTGSGSRAPLAADPHPLVSTLSGTVTFLVMNIEGSMTFRAQAAEAFTAALANYQALLRRQFQRHGGQVVREAG